MNLVRISKVRRTSSFMMRSTYRWRNRVSVSFSPWNFSGRGMRDLDRRVTLWAFTEILAALGLEHLALNAHDIADIGLFELGEGLLASSSMRT